MKITYIGHSGFAVEYEEYVLIFDYYKGKIPRMKKDKQIYVFASHSHHDHFQEKIFEWEREYPNIRYILSDDIRAERGQNRIFLGPDESCEMDGLRIKTLRSTDEGVAFFVSVTGNYETKYIYHAGDLNWWHWEEEGEAYNQEMEENYKRFLSPLDGVRVDVAFVPVDPRLGEAYYWRLDWFMRHTDTELVVPMHMWERYEICDRLMTQPETRDYRDKIMKLGKEDECR